MRDEHGIVGGADRAAGTPSTIGVEEEFLLVDAVDGRPRPLAAPVLAEVHRQAGDGSEAASGTEFKHEFLTSQVEAVSAVCTDLAGLAGQLFRARQALAAAAARSGALVLGCGLPPRGGGELMPVAAGPRYETIAEHYATSIQDYQASGCHIHVGVPDRETAVAVVNHLRPWLPTLLALSANSPFHAERDTSFSSWRITEMNAFPSAGVPPHLGSAAELDREIGRLVECGVLADPRLTFWLARPSPRYPTVEFRVSDAASTAGEAVLQAAVARALVRTALDTLDRGVEAEPLSGSMVRGALWSASRYGLRGPAVDPWRETRVPVAEMLRLLLETVRPALEDQGDLSFVSSGVASLVARGGGADRQRAALARGGFPEVVRQLADEALRVPEEVLPGEDAGVRSVAAAPQSAGA